MERKEFKGTPGSITKDIALLVIGFLMLGFIVWVFAYEAAPLNGVYSKEVGVILGWIIIVIWCVCTVLILKHKIQNITSVILENDSVKIYKGQNLIHDFNVHSAKFEGAIIRRRGVPIGFSLLVDSGEGKKYINLDGIQVAKFQEMMREINKASTT